MIMFALILFFATADASVIISQSKQLEMQSAVLKKQMLGKERFFTFTEKMRTMTAKITEELISRKASHERTEYLALTEEASFNEDGETIDEINQKQGIGELLYQGDIVLTDEQAAEIIELRDGTRGKRQAFKDRNYPGTIWSNGIVYYSFHYSANRKLQELFKKGAMEWQRQTCLSFLEKRNANERIELMVNDGCWSYVGNIHNVQPLSLGRGCETIGTAAHEIGHALGMFHTHSRHDRDHYIRIVTSNIRPSFLGQFQKETETTNDNYGLPYDYGSLMHYGARSFSSDGGITMMPYNANYIYTLGSPFLSFYELLMMNKHYNCLGKCQGKSSAAKCAMGGFPNPRDCSNCVCPGGYGGRLCKERPAGCGRILKAITSYRPFADIVGDRNVRYTNQRDDFLKCNYWITAPAGKRVEIRLVNSTNGIVTNGCYWAGVELKTQKDQRLTGYRFCSSAFTRKIFRSEGNNVPILTYSRIWLVKTTLQYRFSEYHLLFLCAQKSILDNCSLKKCTPTQATESSCIRGFFNPEALERHGQDILDNDGHVTLMKKTLRGLLTEPEQLIQYVVVMYCYRYDMEVVGYNV